MTKELENFVNKANLSKNIYTAGPSSLISAALNEIKPCFGRNDDQYQEAKEFVMKYLRKMSSHQNIVALQGSATLAIEIAIANFCKGRILVIETGYYSKRILNIIKKQAYISSYNVDYQPYNNLSNLPRENYDWILCCYTETSCAFKVDIKLIKKIAFDLNAKLFLDATASIGLEEHHDVADVICYSSCKGLFGLTGGAFIAYNDLEISSTNSFYFDINTHISNLVTGPYHQILSLYGVLKDYSIYLKRVKKWHKSFLEVFNNHLIYDKKNQPVLCTLLDCKVKYLESNPISYKPRMDNKGEVICHIGQVHREYNSINKNLIKKHFKIIKN